MAKSRKPDPRTLDEDQNRQRIRGQIEVIQAALGAENVAWEGDTDDPADFRYLYRRGSILVRDRDLPRVQQVVEGRIADNLIDGLTRFTPADGDVQSALRVIDQSLGIGVATPDHVLFVTPAGGCCPATEPEEPKGTRPLPAVSTDRPFDGSGVLVSVVDTGWHPPAASHPKTPWLAGVTGDVETINAKSIHPYGGHGTFVAGVVRCMAPRADVRVEGFLPHGGAVFESEIVAQLGEALRLAPDIISLSAGTSSRHDLALLGFQVFWETRLRQLKGTVLVAAAGNDGHRLPFWPAAFPWALSVGALDATGQRASFSNFGSWVDLYALGVDLVNAFPKGDFTCLEPPSIGQVRHFDGLAQWSGTSFATPTVSGIIAARMSGTGESARVAADALLRRARGQARAGVGAWLAPDAGNYL